MVKYAGQRRAEKTTTTLPRGWAAAVVGLGLVAVTAGAVIAKPGEDGQDRDASPSAGDPTATGGSDSDSDSTSASRDSCPDAIRVAVPSSYLTVWRQVAADYRPDETCAPVEVDAVPSATVAAERPAGVDAWIPEDSSWLGRAAPGVVPEADRPVVVARTPVALATTASVDQAVGGLQSLLRPARLGPIMRADRPFGDDAVTDATLRIALPDPNASATGSLGFAALVQLATGRPITGPPSYVEPDRRDLTTIRVEHRVQTVAAGDADAIDQLDPTAPDRASAAVTTEYAALAASADDPSGDGLTVGYLGVDLHLPLVALDPDVQAAVASFADHLTGPVGQQALVAAGLRPASGDATPAPGGAIVPAAYPSTGRPAAAEEVASLALLFTAMHQRISSLVLLDASGSMLEPLPGSTVSKIDLVRRAARDTLRVASPAAQTGLITFQSDAADRPVIRTRVPMGLNGADDRGGTHAERLLATVDDLSVSGGTPLYNAVREAYRAAVRGYQDGMVNQVVLLSDGRNQDAIGSISLDRLIDSLRKLRDPARPVRITAIGYGPDADLPTLQRIVAATDGRVSWLKSESGYADAVEAALFTV